MRSPISRLVFSLVALALLAAPARVFAAPDRDPVVDTAVNGKGRINFAAGIVKATGYGAPPERASSPAQARLMSRGAAIADALRVLAMTVSSIQVTATTRVKNYEMQSDVVTTRLSALLENPNIIEESFKPDGTAVVTLELPMYGKNSVASAVFPQILPRTQEAPSAPAAGAFAGPPTPAYPIERPAARSVAPLSGPEPGLTPLSDPGPFTSVIIDCRGLGVNAVMSPRIFDTTGREVYGTVRVSPEYAIETGIASYPRSMAEAIRSARAGSHPLIVRALRVADTHRFHPVISLEDADRILAANNRDKFLLRTAVVLLVDPVQ